jgi:thioredoxin 1
MPKVFDAPIITTDQNLDRLLSAPLPVLILLWDGPELPGDVSQAMIELASREAGRLIVAKINARENPRAAQRFEFSRRLLLVGTRRGQEVTRAEIPQAGEINAHAYYLLGTGDRPERRPPAEKAEVRALESGTGSRPVPVTDATFEAVVLHARLPVLIDFWAPWCGPCRMVAPVLEKLARDYAGRLVIAKVNVDKNPHYAGLYGVQSVPTLMIVNSGQVVDRLVGAMPEHYLRARIDHLLMAH